MVFEVFNSKYNLFVDDWLPATRSIMQLIAHEDTVFFSERKIQLTQQGNFSVVVASPVSCFEYKTQN